MYGKNTASRARGARIVAALVLLAATACGQRSEPAPELRLTRAAVVVNGDFETGTLSGWTVSTSQNYGTGFVYPVQSYASLNLSAGGRLATSTVAGATGTQIPYGLTSTATLRYPKYGSFAAVVNQAGNYYNANTLRQTFTVTNADVDPSDGKIHVRFALAPVFENPSHPFQQQPYFYAEVRNATRGVKLFSRFSYSNEPGVPWKSAANNILYTDWQIFDVAPGNVQLQVGDAVELIVVAAGCAQGGHWGEVYVDGFGAFVPGLSVAATAPAQVNAGDDLTYTYLVKNTSQTVASAVTVKQPALANLTFGSATVDAGGSCTADAGGNVTCNLGDLNPLGSASFSLTYRVAATSPIGSIISNGYYTVSASGVAPVIGPLVSSSVTQGVRYADLAIGIGDGVAAVTWGQPVHHVVLVRNDGPSAVSGAAVSATFPPQLTGVTWTCAAADGGACGTAAGTGPMAATVDLPVGATATFDVDATVVAGTGSASMSVTASVSPPTGTRDPDTTNNTAIDTDAIGNLSFVTVQKDAAGWGSGTVVSSPAAISCGPTCAASSAQFIDGTVVSLTATAVPGDTFVGWTSGCTGTANPCNLTVSGPVTVSAKFTSPKLPNGKACTGDAQCLTGFCVDGVCCDTLCTEQCVACNVSGHAGTCTPVTGAPVNRPACASDGTACGGTCDGTSPTCTYPGQGTACRAASCAAGVETHAASCDGAGACPAPESAGCDAFVCGATACLTSCATFSDCATGNYCSADGRCLFDRDPPVLTLPATRTVEATGPAGASVVFTATATDAVAGAVAVTCTSASGATYPLGTTRVDCTADDGHGNVASGGFDVVVRDTTAPVISPAPADLSVEASGPATSVFWPELRATDGVSGTVPVRCAPASGVTFPVGSTAVSCSATDAAGNTASVGFSVTVHDTTPPSLLGVPGDVVLEATSALGAAFSWAEPMASDLVDGPTAVSCSASPGVFPIGLTEVTCSATDRAGNTARGTFRVSVVDTRAPVFVSVPGSLSVEAAGATGAVVTWPAPSAVDVVDGATAVRCDPASSSLLPVDADVTVRCTTADAHGNAATASFQVRVVDTTPPALALPASVVAEATGPTGAVVTWPTPPAADVVDGDVAVTCTPAPGSAFVLGTTRVTCSATDVHGNAASGALDVVVRDTTAPVVTVPQQVEAVANDASGAIVQFAATATDVVSGAILPTCTPASGSRFAPGTTTVTCSATDAAGNTGTAKFPVLVRFDWTGLLRPVAQDGTSSFKLGRVVPCKFQLAGASTGLSTLSPRIYVAQVSNDVVGTALEAVSASQADTGNTFRYDATAGQYVFNLATDGLARGTWIIRVDLGDGVPHDTSVSLVR